MLFMQVTITVIRCIKVFQAHPIDVNRTLAAVYMVPAIVLTVDPPRVPSVMYMILTMKVSAVRRTKQAKNRGQQGIRSMDARELVLPVVTYIHDSTHGHNIQT